MDFYNIQTSFHRDYFKTASLVSGAILFLFAIGKSFNIDIVCFFATIFSILSCLIAPLEISILIVFYICPNTYFCMFSTSAICGWLALICAIKLLVRMKTSIPFHNLIPCFLLFFYSLVIYFLNNNNSFLSASVKMFGLITMLILLPYFFGKSTRLFLTKLSNAFVDGTVLGACLGVIHYLIHSESFMGAGIISSRFIGLANDPNYLSATFCFAISLILLDLYSFKRRKFEFLCLFILSAVGFLTLSRAFILCYGIILLLYFIIASLKGRLKWKNVLLLLLFGIFGYCVFFRTINNLIYWIIYRFKDNQYSGGGGRLEVWSWYLNQLISSPLSLMFGSVPASIVYELGLVKHIEHNTLIQMLYELGLIGSLLYIISIISPILSYAKLFEHSKTHSIGIEILPVFAVLGPYFFISALTGENFILALAFSLIIGRYISNSDCC